MKTVRIICRSSRLSFLQAEIVKKKIETTVPGISVMISGRSSRGDREHSVPLASLEGTDFFTEEIFEVLNPVEADIAVHSLKDMSAFHFFSHQGFAVVDRDDTRDVAIFNPGIEQKLRNGESIIVGTCSSRREEMAVGFLNKALPQLSPTFGIETRFIRGNVESRLQQLDTGDFDGTILATAGLNRLLRGKDAPFVKDLLSRKRIMFLPLVECVPAPCQGAIVAEVHPENKDMMALLKSINDEVLFEDVYEEKREAYKYGTGSLQSFGVTTITTAAGKVRYAAGINTHGQSFSKWHGLPEINVEDKKIFSTTDYMGKIFEYEFFNEKVDIDEPVVFVANYKSIHQKELLTTILTKRVWASGTKTWFELAKRGVWVEGSADAFGLESLQPVFKLPLVNIPLRDVHIITHHEGAKHWLKKGWKATATYRTTFKNNPAVGEKISEADIIFWTSIHQFLQYKEVLKEDALHLASSGETTILLQHHGIRPIIFPNIKAFEQWRKSATRLHSVA